MSLVSRFVTWKFKLPPAETHEVTCERDLKIPMVESAFLTLPAGTAATKRDVLVYSSEQLERDLEVVGPLQVELFVKSSLAYTDFFARLCDVFPDGKSINLADGISRVEPGRFNEMEGGVLKVHIELWPTANCFQRGHRIRLQVSSGAHPRFARNPGSGEALGAARQLSAAEQQVFHAPGYPSAVILPVKA